MMVTNRHNQNNFAFTLIELLVVIAIIGVLSGVSLFAMQGSRESARDARRKADIEAVRSALELYRSDCNEYPASVSFDGTQIVGDDSNTSCLSTNVYMEKTPEEVLDDRDFCYDQTSDNTYDLCAALEAETTAVSSGCACTDDCGGIDCTYRVTSP